MNRIWSVVLILLVLTWGSPTPAGAVKVEHFKDDQGTLHITNEKAEGQTKVEAAPAAPPAPLRRPMLPPAPPPPGVSTAPPAPVEAPEATPEPEAPQTEAPPETETQPDSN